MFIGGVFSPFLTVESSAQSCPPCVCNVHRSNEDFMSYFDIVHAHAVVILGGEKYEIIASLIKQKALCIKLCLLCRC